MSTQCLGVPHEIYQAFPHVSMVSDKYWDEDGYEATVSYTQQ